MNTQPRERSEAEALRLASCLERDCRMNWPDYDNQMEASAELRRLHEENEGLRKAYWKMRNSAAGYSNFCDDNASTRRCEREYEEGEALYRAAIAKAESTLKTE